MNPSPQTETTIESKNSTFFDLREIWSYRELFYFFTWRDIKVKYKQTALGVLWVMLQPLLMMLTFTFFFGRMLGVASDGIPYPVFALSGFILWSFFSNSITTAGNSMVLNSPIIKKIYFPRLIIPISSVFAAWVDLTVSLLLFVMVLIFYQVPVDFVKLFTLWPLAFGMCMVGAMGFGCWLSALMVKYRDFRFIMGFAIQIGFFLTPIAYPLSQVQNQYLKYVLALNPIYGAILLFRMPLYDSFNGWLYVAISAASAVLFLIVGLVYFKRTELYFADLS